MLATALSPANSVLSYQASLLEAKESTPIFTASETNYLFDPVPFSAEQFAEEIKGKDLDMSWHSDLGYFRFVSRDGEVDFEVNLKALTSSDPKICDPFIINETAGESKEFNFSYSLKKDGSEEVNSPSFAHYQNKSFEGNYWVADRREIENGRPQLMSSQELVQIIKNYNVLFYTGAGLSAASNIPTMSGLEKIFNMGDGRFFTALEEMAQQPKETALKILDFHKACVFSIPSPAHYALKELSIFKKTRILTENLDCLHEASGIFPYRIDPKKLQKDVPCESISQFNYVICIGLSHDDRGFLGWFKQHNPQGKLIAIDLSQPSYLGDEDFLITADLQELIPSICNQVVNAENMKV